jgi:predicted acylesterase/phospholipase RssA
MGRAARGPRARVKGLGLVGVVWALKEAGNAFPRVAGTSAGAIVGAFVAALEAARQGLARSLIGAMLSGHDQLHLDDPCVRRRTVFVGASGVSATNFALTREKRDRRAGRRFLGDWDEAAYLRECRAGDANAASGHV